jgi:hypothetical protein
MSEDLTGPFARVPSLRRGGLAEISQHREIEKREGKDG